MTCAYYLGPQNSYSHILAKKVFGDDYQLLSCPNFAEIVEKVMENPRTIGVLPIENSITSNIHENMDYLFHENLKIVQEAYLKINLYLIGLHTASLEDIIKVYSHPKALAQCKNFIQNYHLSFQETVSTANAKDLILQIDDKRAAAIGSKELANDPRLTIVLPNIGDNHYNITRFFLVSSQRKETQGNKSSIIFTIPHTPGSLANLLMQLADRKINITKIESRPIPGTEWEYQFWIDVEVTPTLIDRHLISQILQKYASTYKILGVYERGTIYES